MTIPKIIITILLMLSLTTNIVASAQVDFNDSDGDGLSNNLEDNISFTDKNSFDTDGDGYSDGYEYFFKFSGGDPLDPNKFPKQLTVEEDTDGDGFRDLGFDISSFVLGQTFTVLGSSNILEPTCTLTIADVAESEYSPLNCSYPLKGGTNDGYFFAFEGYNASLESTPNERSTDCYILNNKTPQATLQCQSIPYKNAVLNTQKIILTRTIGLTNNREELTANKTIEVVNYGDQLLSSVLTPSLDNQLIKSCIAVEPTDMTTCTFQLPALTTLPLDYKIGVGTVPSGSCNADDKGLVTCKNVPTSTQGLDQFIRSNYKSTLGDVTAQKAMMLAVNTSVFKTYNVAVDTTSNFPIIKDIDTEFEGAVILTFVGDTSINLGRIEKGIFTPINPELYPKLEANTSIQGIITIENGVGNNIGPIAKLNIKTLPLTSNPPSNPNSTPIIKATPKPPTNLSRTGGSNSVYISLIFSLIFMAISNYFIFFNKSKSNPYVTTK
jgi:hypothetical protein